MGTRDAVGGAQGTLGQRAGATIVAPLAAWTSTRDSGDNSRHAKNPMNVILTSESGGFFLQSPCLMGDKSLS